MSIQTRIFAWLYTQSLKLYPAQFRANFSDEMQSVFDEISLEAGNSPGKMLALFGREIRDWPGAVWQEHLYAKEGYLMNQNYLAWKPLNTKELLLGLAFFAVPILGHLEKLLFGYNTITNQIGHFLLLTVIAGVIVMIIMGITKGFPRWTLPYFSSSIIGVVMLTVVFPIWGLFADDIRRLVKYHTKTLAARIQYSALLGGFFWLVAFIVLALIIVLLMIWPRTRALAQRIRKDWTLASFMIYSALVFNLELIFQEYAYDEAWKISCLVFLFLGAWVYFKIADQRKRILSLFAGAALVYWIAAVGKWYLVPLQTWGAFHGYQYEIYRRFEFWRTLAEWGWVMLFMLIPALLMFIPRIHESDPAPGENLAPA